MNWAVVILKEPGYYLTLGTVRYGQWGERNQQPIITCESWIEGFNIARNRGFTHALFVKSGTVFRDWEKWCELINKYPHQGLVGHIIWHPGHHPYLDDQCWFMDLAKFTESDFNSDTIQQPIPMRSKNDLHDDYTPLWLRPTDSTETFVSTAFGQGLIAQQLNNNRSVVNWNNAARDIKKFAYKNEDVLIWFSEYIELAETQLWVFNNEPITVSASRYLVAPGSGLYWMLHKCHPEVEAIDIVDISKTQIDFCNHVQKNWDGSDYGQFVWDYITKHNLIHYELDRTNLSRTDRLLFKKQKVFVDYVNNVFAETVKQAGIVDFKNAWTNSKCKVKITLGNLVEYTIPRNARVWMSNILDYKYTLLTTDYNTLLNYEKAN